ncbi:Fimbrial protein pilin [Candidatus Koribacter versatilis Ellin345]|uniref:Fimbrial protein pilin n=1 Tax=Koribacter versatilis (strain Ellin345) TaxID=204669 RepID=Q1IMB1_KORVE|nr:prepilin-type N-terminal cleavage/methylation domain-containing protein [Candidatus Koribacter versatilis]ABF41989.1 Fimbrial protein pilin [Candidatus Koribacter versatilis Ellin345]
MAAEKGFSLIELLIVVAIILIIAAIAIPNLLRSRMAANEASAVGSLRTINTAEMTYSSAYPDVGFTLTLTNLAGPTRICDTGSRRATSTRACLIDNVLGAGTKSGYTFVLSGAAAATPQSLYSIAASPITVGSTGQRGFYSDETGVIRYNQTGSATSNDNALQ